MFFFSIFTTTSLLKERFLFEKFTQMNQSGIKFQNYFKFFKLKDSAKFKKPSVELHNWVFADLIV
jgi:hypothetical protein